MKNTKTRALRTRIIAAAMALVAIAGTTTVMIKSTVNNTSICASAESAGSSNTETPEWQKQFNENTNTKEYHDFIDGIYHQMNRWW